MEKISFKEACVIIGCTEKTLKARYKAWGVPYYKIGSMTRFSPREVYSWIESNAHNQPANIEE